MADGDQTQTNPLLDPQLMQLVQQLQPPQPQVDQTPMSRSWTSLLGERLGGGPQIPGMSDAQREAAGSRALMNFGIGLMGNVRYGENAFTSLAAGFRDAGHSELQSAQMAAGTLASQQAYQQQQFTNKMEALKTAIPLLQQSRMANMPNPLAGGGGGGAGGPGGGAPGGGGGGLANIYGLPKDQFLQAVAQRESGGDPTAINYVAKADPTAIARGATASGKYQMVDSTWLTAAKAAGIDTAKYPTARSAPEALQDQAASKLYDMQGTAPWDPSKWTKNWVQGSDGKYTLATAPYTPPPGRGDTKPDSKTPPTQAAGAPGAPPAVQFGGEPPAPPGAAPGAPAATGGIGTALNPPTGREVSTVAPPPVVHQAPIPGQPGGDAASRHAAAILQGVQTAQASPTPPGTVLAAGPAAGTPPAAPPAAPTPAPGWGAKVGDYNVGGLTTTTPTPAAATPPTPPTTQPAAPAPQVTTQATQPPQGTAPQTFEQWQQQHPSAVTLPPAPTVTVDQQALAAAQAAKNTAAQQLSAARMSGNVEAGTKAASAYDEASNRIATLQQQAQVESAKMQQQQASKQLELQHQMYDAEQTRIQQAQLKQQELAQTAAEADKNRQNQLDVERAKAGFGWRQKMAEDDAKTGNDLLGKLDEGAMGSAGMQSILQLVGPQLKNLPTGVVAQVLADHPGMVNYLKAAHILDGDQADATQLLQGLTSFMATEMKPKGLGPLRVQEMNAFQGSLPTLLQSTEGRQKAFAFINAYSQRIQDEADFAHNYFKRDVPNDQPDAKPGSTMPARNLDGMWKKMGQPVEQGGLGSVMPMWTGGTKTAEDAQNYKAWEAQQAAKPGNVYWQLRKNPQTGVREMQLTTTPPAGG